MVGSQRRVRSNHASYHFVFTKAAWHGPVQELLVDQDAVDMLHRGSTQNGYSDQKMARECSVDDRVSSIICACHRSRKNKSDQDGRFTRNRGSFAGSQLFLARIRGEKKKLRLVIILSSMVHDVFLPQRVLSHLQNPGSRLFQFIAGEPLVRNKVILHLLFSPDRKKQTFDSSPHSCVKLTYCHHNRNLPSSSLSTIWMSHPMNAL